ncbi:MAG: nucleotidyltransferase family protein [Duncaniella sp.]|nr:nucleotidyltransferase family protein [Duncaniella sp.]
MMAYRDPAFIKLFFSLLRSGLYGKPLTDEELPESIDWEGVVALAQRHGVQGTIIESVQLLPDRLRPYGQTMARMGKFALGLIHANMILDRTVGKLVAFLREHGVDGVLLKGQGVARYYRKPQMRQSGDIDFYVGNEVYQKAVDLCNVGLNVNKKTSYETEQHYVFYTDGVEIELHRLATERHSHQKGHELQKWIVEELEGSAKRRALVLGGTEVALPSYDFDALYIFYHAWHHLITGGIGLRQLCDWAMIFNYHSDDIDTDKLKDNIHRFGLTRGWKLFAYIAVKYLGVEEDKIPLYDPRHAKRYERVMKEIVLQGNFGTFSKSGVKKDGYRLSDEIEKFRCITEYSLALFPIIPAEAVTIYFKRAFSGIGSHIARTLRRPGKNHHKS